MTDRTWADVGEGVYIADQQGNSWKVVQSRYAPRTGTVTATVRNADGAEHEIAQHATRPVVVVWAPAAPEPLSVVGAILGGVEVTA